MAAMISDSAKQGINQIFTRACASLTLDAGDSVAVNPIHGGNFVEPPGQLLVLTIANFSFKLLVIFHFEASRETGQYFSKPEAGLGCADVFPEIANLCCGAMNRELGGYFTHLGMSTPYQLDRQCLPFIEVLKPAYLAQHRIVINGDVILHATLCLCAYAPVDFRYVASAPETASGALELF
ncbi:MAG: hypothetical protein Q8R51_07355 [Azonexus sp.]|nr:hypothetical protein [Azonexus sp.]